MLRFVIVLAFFVLFDVFPGCGPPSPGPPEDSGSSDDSGAHSHDAAP